MRLLVPIAVGFVLACASDDAATSGAGGAGGAGSVVTTAGPGGSAGSNAATGGTGGATSTGGGGSGGSSGDAGSKGGEDAASGDSGDASTGDASDAARDVSMTSDADMHDASGGSDGNPGGDTLPGKPWIHLCPKADTHEECCAFLCNCLATVCADSPLDKTGIANCMTNCPMLTDMMLRCHVYHCYESLNPSVPQDHASHCGHASGRVAGGGCPPAVYGP